MDGVIRFHGYDSPVTDPHLEDTLVETVKSARRIADDFPGMTVAGVVP
jgi:hypothetical protein